MRFRSQNWTLIDTWLIDYRFLYGNNSFPHSYLHQKQINLHIIDIKTSDGHTDFQNIHQVTTFKGIELQVMFD